MIRLSIGTFVLFFFGIVNGQHSIGSACTIDETGYSGECKPLENCTEALQLLQEKKIPQSCRSDAAQPLFCCPLSSSPSSRKAGEISKQKCKEYAEYVNVSDEDTDPSLPGAEESEEEDEEEDEILECESTPPITGRHLAFEKEFPHVAIIGYGSPLQPHEKFWMCGGTVISDRHILTAGHCLLHPVQGPARYVQMGITNVSIFSTPQYNKQEFDVIERIPHPEYNSTSFYHDIGILKLDIPIDFDTYARPACLYTKSTINAARAIDTSWGNLLQLVYDLDLVEAEKCNESYMNQNLTKLNKGIVNQVQLCAGSGADVKFCEEEHVLRSGGPLQIRHKDDDLKCMYDIIGVNSLAKTCNSNIPGIYTRISPYVKWIEDTVWPEEPAV